jgi:regulator of cell morphogenesis and NO signaling
MNDTTNMQLDTMTVAQIAVEHPEALQVFNKYDIDYCCGGERNFKDACVRIGLEPAKISQEISQLSAGTFSTPFRIDSWSSSLLVDYIIQNHHAYVRKAIPEIQALLAKVVDAHGADDRELPHIQKDFSDLAEELLEHMHKEEYILFPAIKRLEQGRDLEHLLALTIQVPIGSMEHEHESAGKILKAIRSRSNNYTPPDFACPTFRITYKKLEEFERDLMTHIHLENNILFERMKEFAHPVSA